MLLIPVLTSSTHAAPPNILFILTEDQGAEVSHPVFENNNCGDLHTPHMDALIERGVAFTKAYVSTPVCSASKAGIYTGLYGHTNGIRQNTINFFAPANQLSQSQLSNALYRRATIDSSTPTLITELKKSGYHLGITGKLHVGRNEAFPYDNWIRPTTGRAVDRVIKEAQDANKPWFLWYNVGDPHRPFGAADRVKPESVTPPSFLPNTPTARKEWAAYLSDVEDADDKIGQALDQVKQLGDLESTVIVFLGDHGPAYHRGKMSPHEFGLRTVLAISGPNLRSGTICDQPVSTLDLMPTLLELIGTSLPERLHGRSLLPVLRSGDFDGAPRSHRYVVSEVSASRSDSGGIQERSIFDGRYRLIYREKLGEPRQVNVDLWKSKYGQVVNNATSYQEIVKRRIDFPNEFEMLAEINNAQFATHPPQFELYDCDSDRYNIRNLAIRADKQPTVLRLYNALRLWAVETQDMDTKLQTHVKGEYVSEDFESFPVHHDGRPGRQVVYQAKSGNLATDPDWQTFTDGKGPDFRFDEGVVRAPQGAALALHDPVTYLQQQSFQLAVTLAPESGYCGLVFGGEDASNYHCAELSRRPDSPKKPISLRIRRRSSSGDSILRELTFSASENADEVFSLNIVYKPMNRVVGARVYDSAGKEIQFAEAKLPEELAIGSRFGICSATASDAFFEEFSVKTIDRRVRVGDFNGDGVVDTKDGDLITASCGPSRGKAAIYNLALPDDRIDEHDLEEWRKQCLPKASPTSFQN